MKIFTTLYSLIFSIISIQMFANYNDANPPVNPAAVVACNGFTYCESFGNIATSEWIESFELNTISNASGSDGGYADYTDFSTDLVAGNTYPITCEPGLVAGFTEFFRVWIDYNIDGDFDDANELVFDPGGSSTTQTGTITIPGNAVNGSTTMRVSMKYAATSEPCEQGFTFGEVEDYCVNIVGANGCYLPFLSISGITENSATVDWEVVPSAVSYNIRYRTIGAPTWTEITQSDVGVELMDLEGCANYELQIKTDCDTVASDYSFSYLFLTFGCGNCIDVSYCGVTSPFATYGYIDNVTLGTLNSTTGDDAGFGDFTGPIEVSLEQGLTYDISVTHAFPSFQVSNWYIAWIDFNADGDFDDPFETILDSEETTLDLTVSNTFPIPPTATVGTTRMRVMMQAFGGPPLPCQDFLTGEYEDYCVEIAEGTGCYLPLSLEAVDFQEENVTIVWDQGLNVESFTIRYREVGTFTWINIDDITGNIYELMDLVPCTEYELQLQSVCQDITTDFSNPIYFRTFGCGACFDHTYCESFSNSTVFEYINSFSLGTLNNPSGDNLGYVDFEDQFELTLNPDSTYDISVEPFYPFSNYNVNWRVWIDFNQDGDFDDITDLLYDSGLSNTSMTAQVTIPSNVEIGLTKMRVSMKEFNTQTECENFFYGEVEDYCVTVQPIVLPCITPENLDTMVVTTFSAEMIWDDDQYEVAIGYVVRYKKIADTDWTEVSSVEKLATAFSLSECTDYEFQVRAVCPQDISDYSESYFFKTGCLTDIEEQIENAEDISALMVYPNPFKDEVNVQITLEKNSDLNVQLFGIDGQLVFSRNMDNLPAGDHSIEIDNQDQLSSGMYFLRIGTENSFVTKKLIKN